MYAVLLRGKIADGRYDEARAELHERIVPMVKGAPGFVRGTWFGDGESANAVTVFDSEESARRMMAQAESQPDDGPVKIETLQGYEVHAEA